jgi:uncharacterized protein (DUF849 family)
VADVAVQACLNGGRTRAEHPVVPQTPAELAADAAAVRRAGASSVHLHARNRRGTETMEAAACDAAIDAIRTAVPGLPVGLSTSAEIDPDPFARAASVRAWRRAPDFVSVNLSELGWAGIVRAALHAGIAVEAGLSTPDDADELARSPFAHQVLRALVEVSGGPDEARAISRRIPETVTQLWHGEGPGTWEVLAAAIADGHEIRVGFEDVLELPDGRVAQSNAELVEAAIGLGSRSE